MKDFGAETHTTISFPLHEKLTSQQQMIAYWNEAGKTWEILTNAEVIDGRLQAEVTRAGIYMLVGLIP